jgi:hypothetical protein
LNPSQAGEAAITQYDSDGDQKLSAAELKGCPGIDIAKYDTDGDKHVGADEIRARLEAFLKQGVSRLQFPCVVTLNRGPLSGATVRLVPESFFGGSIQAASGTTDGSGTATLGIEDGIGGVGPGVYKVEITHPDQNISARYNTETTLGCEVDPTNPYAPISRFDVTQETGRR